MNVNRFFVWAVSAVFSFASFGASADERSAAEIKQLALEAILENPEIIMQAVELIQRREEDAQQQAVQNVLSGQREVLEYDPNAPVIGNPDGNATVVEFFDYNCPYCKRAAPIVKGMIDEDTELRVVYREWPILGDGSVFAARAALAARNQGKYEEFHWALMELGGRATEASVMRVASELGLDEEQLHRDMNAPEVDEHFQTSARLAEALGFSGTPSFVIGEALVPGLTDAESLKRRTSAVREDQ
ncbi:DsbA family protein [Parasedimentitalea maritima]|uniref:Thioredoxin domain-containing protein n=1 Tax=Parasedimentitalea maritima TaxID=2578117 RepID=A0A6A4R9M0_9RHOB|nr:DsbA family protein [Zongyanglinia marina]KAE9625888.1 thioredoxin domain-containing protein [Zongyanglinia marina]